MANSLRTDIKEYRVSSVLNSDRKLFGKKYLFDGNEETCWNSDKGVPQWVDFSFATRKDVHQILIQFQGGFAAKSCILECADECETNDPKSDVKQTEFFPKDSNEAQNFLLETPISATRFKLSFTSSFDFYGRIIIYNLDVLGT